MSQVNNLISGSRLFGGKRKGGVGLAKRYVSSLAKRWLNPYVGSKAENIHFLLRHGNKVPDSWVVNWKAYEDSLCDEHRLQIDIRRELIGIIDPEKRYAVRSSASVEDADDFSCAGLFKSCLQVQGIDNIMTAIGDVWQSLESPEFAAYCQNIISPGMTPSMAVIIQEMIQPLFSGVVFTKNPVTGFSETIIEAGPGTGESQVQCQHDPERWVSKWGNWLQKPQGGGLSETLAREIVVKAREISLRYRQPVDLEWAWDGEELYFLQVRPITRLDIPIYSNRISREMLPGIIKPLVWSVNTQLINPVWATILGRLTGEHSWNPVNFTGHYYYRAYFNMSIFAKVFVKLGMPAEALELLFGLEQDGPEKPKMRPGPSSMKRLPGLIAFAISLTGIHYRLSRLVKMKNPAYEKLAARMDKGLDSQDLMHLAEEIFNETEVVAYYNIIIPLLAMMHHQLLSNLLKNHGYDLRSLELRGAKEAAVRYNPHHTLQRLHDTYFGGLEATSEACALPPQKEEQLMKDIDRFLQDFGHLSDSGNDCSSIPWREAPDLVRRMVVHQNDVSVEAQYQRFEDLKLSLVQRIFIGAVYRRASRLAADREKISFLYTYGYGQFRTCFVRLGEQLVKQGLIDDREDIYYLYWSELSELLENQQKRSQQALVTSRRQAIESYRDAVIPEMIIGSEQPPVMTDVQGSLQGIPTSLGTYCGPVRVIQGIDDLEKMQEGDVLVIPFADIGWTPLFAKAGAVVSESGGMLSHTSIVAREYRIPAVVSVTGACRIEDNTLITVNGYTGDIVMCREGRGTL